LVPADVARAPVVEAVPRFLQILPVQQALVVEHPNDDDNNDNNDTNRVMDDQCSTTRACQQWSFLFPLQFNKFF